jgi:hypothetical protein
MITLNTRLTKDDCLFIYSEIKALLAMNENRGASINSIQEFVKRIIDLAERGQIEAIEYYYRLNLPPNSLFAYGQSEFLKDYYNSSIYDSLINSNLTSFFNNTLFKHVSNLIRNKNCDPRSHMALYAYYSNLAKQKVGNIEIEKDYENALLNSNEYRQARYHFETSIKMLRRSSYIDALSLQYLTEMGYKPENKDIPFSMEMSNFRSYLMQLISHQTNSEKKYKLRYGLYKNALIFSSQDELSKNKVLNLRPEITYFLNESQKSAFIQHTKGVFI